MKPKQAEVRRSSRFPSTEVNEQRWIEGTEREGKALKRGAFHVSSGNKGLDQDDAAEGRAAAGSSNTPVAATAATATTTGATGATGATATPAAEYTISTLS